MYYEKWEEFDPKATGYITLEKTHDLLDALEAPLRMKAPNRWKLAILDVPLYKLSSKVPTTPAPITTAAGVVGEEAQSQIQPLANPTPEIQKVEAVSKEKAPATNVIAPDHMLFVACLDLLDALTRRVLGMCECAM